MLITHHITPKPSEWIQEAAHLICYESAPTPVESTRWPRGRPNNNKVLVVATNCRWIQVMHDF